MRQSGRVSSVAAQARSVKHYPKFRLFLGGVPILRTKNWIYLGLIVAAFVAFVPRGVAQTIIEWTRPGSAGETA
jgi:hypothetical protein